jgi:hypothetical protein
MTYVFTAEHKAKLSAAMRRRVYTPETRAKLSVSNMGHEVTSETREKISRAQLGRSRGPLSPEHRSKVSGALMGHEVTEDTRNAISAARTGMEFTNQHCQNISAGKSGAKWITEIFSDRERQIPRDEAEQLVSAGDWRWGRNEVHRSRVAAGVR